MFFCSAGQHAAINPTHPVLIVKTPTPTTGLVKRLPALTGEMSEAISRIPPPQQQQAVTAGTSPAAPSQPGIAEIPAAPLTAPQPATPALAQTTLSTVSAAVDETLCQETSTVTPSPGTPASSPSDSITPDPRAAPSSVLPISSSSSLSTTAAAVNTSFGRTSKYVTKDSPRTLGVKCIVDFESFYCYLGQIHKPTDDCCLTAMGEFESHLVQPPLNY